MRFELFVALRYLFARRKQTFITVISIMAMLGVALGVGSLVIVLGVYSGFSKDIRDKILGANAQIIVSGVLPYNDYNEIIQRLVATDGVRAATPFLYAEGMISSPRGVKGLIIRGIDSSTAGGVIGMLGQLTEGSLQRLESEDEAPGVLVGQELAKRLQLSVGSRVNLLSPAGQRTATGFQPRIRPFVVAGIFNSGMYEYDSSLVYVSLPAGRNLMNLSETAISGFELLLDDVYEADNVAHRLRADLGPTAHVRTWTEMNANLFAALQLEKIGMFIVLAMVVLVGSFSIVTTLVMMVMEKTKDIAVLMAMGATKNTIRRIFILQGTIIGLFGTSFGLVCGIALGLALQEYQFIKLPPGVYTIDHLPIVLRFGDIALVSLSAMTLCFLATIYPARKAASLQPAEALRYE